MSSESLNHATAAEPLAAQHFQPLIEQGILAGAIFLVADRAGVRKVETLGHADLAARRPMPPDAMFWIASTSKAITGAAITMLIEAGKIDPSAPVENYLPEFKGLMVAVERDEDHVLLKKPSHPITVRETLCHTSGLPFVSPIEHPALDALPLSAAVRSHAMMALDGEPSTKYLYSNAGTNTAARILEVVTGERIEDFLQTRLFDPLDMRDTTFWPNDEQVARLAKAYRLTGTEDAPGKLEAEPIYCMTYPLTDRVRRFPFPAGGLFSTAADVAKFGRMIANFGTLDGRRYLSEASIREMTAKQTAPAVSEEYGYLWSCAEGFWGHGGAYRNQFTVDPRTGITTVLMIQSAGAGDALVRAAWQASRAAAVERFGS